MFTAVSDYKLSTEEKASMKECTAHSRSEHTARMAIKTIIWDMILSNDKMRHKMQNQSKAVSCTKK